MVIMRLPETCSPQQQGELDSLLASLRSVDQRRRGRRRDGDESGRRLVQREVSLFSNHDGAKRGTPSFTVHPS